MSRKEQQADSSFLMLNMETLVIDIEEDEQSVIVTR